MIDVNQLVIGIVSGSVLITVALLPNLFQALVDGVRNFQARVTGLSSLSVHEPVRQPVWLAYAGAALIAFALLAYFTH